MNQTHPLLIGWAGRDITPSRPANLLGQFHIRISKGVLDPVTLTALSLSTKEDALIWVSCDLCGIPEDVLDKCRARLKRLAPDFPAEKLVANATHTHTAPDPFGGWYPPINPEQAMLPAEYGELVAERMAEAAAESWRARKPGLIGWGYGHAVVGHNRRAVYFDDLSKRPGFTPAPGTKTEKSARMYGNTNDPQFSGFEGYVDHGVNLLFTFDAAKQLTGAVYNVPCTAQETEGLDVISADFWHETRLELRKRHGDKLFLLPQAFPAGDLSPHLLYNKKAEARMLKLKNRTTRQEIAQRLAAAFDEVYAVARLDLREAAVLKHAVRTLSLDRRRITEKEYREAKAGLAELEAIPPDSAAGSTPRSPMERDDVCFARKFRCRRILKRYAEQKKKRTLPMELHVIRLGDIALATNSFELFLDFGLRMVARSPAEQTFLTQLCGGGTMSYLATEKAVAGESYSACLYCNEVSPAGGQQLVEETLSTLNALWA